MSEFSFIVTHIDSATDISSNVETLTVVETGTGEISSAEIRLESDSGKYVTTAPKLDEYHKIRVQITDEDSNTFDKVYEVHNIIPVESAQEGNAVDLECYGLEWHLQHFYFAKQFYFESAFNVVKDIVDIYNDTKGDNQPQVHGHDATTYNDGTVVHETNELPQWTANMYNFNIAEKRCYDGCVDVINRLGNTVAAGGANDFFELYFTKHSTDNTKIDLQAFVSGEDPTSGQEVTITDADSINEDPTEGGIESTQGTVVASWGADDFGSQPVEPSKFHGELEAFALEPHWQSGVSYPQNARVQYQGTHYQSDIDDNTSTPPTNWTAKEVREYLTDEGLTSYTPWTDGLATSWENSGSNPSGAALGFSEEGMWDSNMVIWDENHYATWATKRVTSDTVGVGAGDVPSQYLYSGTDYYRGFRVLVDPNIGAIGAPFDQNSGNDRFGNAYSGNVVQHNGGTETGGNRYLNWDVVRVTSDNDEVAVIHEGAIYIKETGTWTDRHTQSRTNHPFHGYTSVSNNAGVNDTFSNAAKTTTYGDSAAVEVQYDYNTFNLLSDLVLTDANYYAMGAWLNLAFPFPHNTYNSVSTLGSLWGNNTSKKEPVTFDPNNMHLSHSGNVGFNHSESEEYGPCSALSFAMKLKWTEESTGSLMLAGDFKMRCFMYDTDDNVVVQDFVLTHNDLWQDVSLPLSNFRIYRARTPWRRTLDGTDPVFLLNDLDIVNTFNWKNIKMIGFQTQDSYNDEGQYVPEGSRFYRDLVTTLLSGRIILSIDRFHFTKPLLAVTDPVTSGGLGRAIFPEFRQQPLISNYRQLKQDALSWLEIAKFRHKRYEVKREGRLDVNYGDTFFLNKSDIVPDDDTRTADTGGTSNNIRLVAKRIVHKISKSSSESGDYVTYLTGIKRLLS